MLLSRKIKAQQWDPWSLMDQRLQIKWPFKITKADSLHKMIWLRFYRLCPGLIWLLNQNYWHQISKMCHVKPTLRMENYINQTLFHKMEWTKTSPRSGNRLSLISSWLTMRESKAWSRATRSTKSQILGRLAVQMIKKRTWMSLAGSIFRNVTCLHQVSSRLILSN